MQGALSEELKLFQAAWHEPRGLASALNTAYSYTHDKEGKQRSDSASYSGNIGRIQDRINAVFATLKVDPKDVSAKMLGRDADIREAVTAAANEALDSGVHAMSFCAARLRADLDSMDDKDANVTATDLLASASAAASAAKGINGKNIGAAKRAVHDVEAVQAELAKRSGPKVEQLAKRIGHNTSLSVDLHTLHQRIDQVAKESRHK
jgi:hypothetical protein